MAEPQVTYDVRMWKIEPYKGKEGTTYAVRWVVAGRRRRETFGTKALAETFRSELLTAMRRGEAFDVRSGLPVSMTRKQEPPGLTWYQFACNYVDMKWPGAAGKTRVATADALATVTPFLVNDDSPDEPAADLLRRGLIGWAFNSTKRNSEPAPADVARALLWIERNSIQLSAFADPERRPIITRGALDALALKMDGTAAAATTRRRKRAVLYNALGYAVELGLLPANPIDTIQWRNPEVAEEVDRRVVASPDQVRQLLIGVSYVGRQVGERFVAFFALLYFAALRPSEALSLRAQDCVLPESGWGRLLLEGSRPEVGRAWTDDGERTEQRGLKWRGRKEVRPVPIPPELVRILRQHLAKFGTASDGRLFYTAGGGHCTQSSYYKAWEQARGFALPPAIANSPVAARPYDLRHGGVSLWLNAGVPAPEVARRAGHGVDVLLKIYAGCIDGEEAVANRRIQEALGGK